MYKYIDDFDNNNKKKIDKHVKQVFKFIQTTNSVSNLDVIHFIFKLNSIKNKETDSKSLKVEIFYNDKLFEEKLKIISSVIRMDSKEKINNFLTDLLKNKEI
ncbi:hypothetical protein KQ875_00690 [Mycoplasma zalophi]|uniref:Uncharacterized protein n=1 Tax=Mycoplasma zalophi TaxID=191287 RepID=A0ABS6DP66_9MOLU|nr:hypothetical protein [Mycoplasma zalophi]MBU4692115.1 hypothetical protein [Mycoplasma zalophi]